GTYFVTLTLTDLNYCNAPQSIVDTLRIAENVDARFLAKSDDCVLQPLFFENVSLGGQRFSWTISKAGTPLLTSTTNSLTYTFQDTGQYAIRLEAFDPNTCNLTDDTTVLITIHGNPTARFDYSPKIPTRNALFQFDNISLDAVRYVWDFGDATPTVETTSLTAVQHEYLRSGRYRVCLTAYNEYGCSDDTCLGVEADIDPVLDVPNAFTPGRGGINSVIKVRGFGIERMKWVIYNRWGQIVFESSQKENGWDGTYQGKLQPMDVYTYILEVQFSDATKARKLGDITLIR
ncbi:MAG: PKD domain-containing protein, partial [Chitinophagaceae bacterium]